MMNAIATLYDLARYNYKLPEVIITHPTQQQINDRIDNILTSAKKEQETFIERIKQKYFKSLKRMVEQKEEEKKQKEKEKRQKEEEVAALDTSALLALIHGNNKSQKSISSDINPDSIKSSTIEHPSTKEPPKLIHLPQNSLQLLQNEQYKTPSKSSKSSITIKYNKNTGGRYKRTSKHDKSKRYKNTNRKKNRRIRKKTNKTRNII